MYIKALGFKSHTYLMQIFQVIDPEFEHDCLGIHLASSIPAQSLQAFIV